MTETLAQEGKELDVFFYVDSHSAPSCNRFGHNGKKTIILTFNNYYSGNKNCGESKLPVW